MNKTLVYPEKCPPNTIIISMNRKVPGEEYLTHNEVELAIMERQEVIRTTCTRFFDTMMLSNEYNVIVYNRYGKIDLYDLMSNKSKQYTVKQMRLIHRVEHMLLANAFTYQNVTEEEREKEIIGKV